MPYRPDQAVYCHICERPVMIVDVEDAIIQEDDDGLEIVIMQDCPDYGEGELIGTCPYGQGPLYRRDIC